MIKPTKKQIAFMNFTNEEIKYELNVKCRELNKDLSNLMECLRKQEKDNKAILFVGRNFKKVILPYEEYQKMYQRLEAIDNANPSEALEVVGYLKDHHLNAVPYYDWLNEIEQYILKAQEQEKVLEIVKEKQVDICELKICIDEYEDSLYQYNKRTIEKFKLTQEEFDLLKKILGQTQI